MTKNAFNHYGFTDDHLKKMLLEPDSYWKACYKFVKGLKNEDYRNLTLRQRNWANTIKEDVEKL